MFREHYLDAFANVRKLGKAKFERIIQVKVWRTFFKTKSFIRFQV